MTCRQLVVITLTLFRILIFINKILNSGRQAKDIRVMYGSNRIRDPNATYVDADEFIPHPLYVDHNFNFNIGLIKLKEQIVLGPKVKAIKLPTSDDLNSTYPAIGSGWGRFHVSAKKFHIN